MKLLDRKTKLEIYQAVKEEILKEREYGTTCIGLCGILSSTMKNHSNEVYRLWFDNLTSDLFPEVYKRKPNTDNQYWFPREDFDSRIKLIEECIKELEKSYSWYNRFKRFIGWKK